MRGGFDFKREFSLETREGSYLFLAMVIMFYSIGGLLAVAVHEVFGHGLFTEALGGEFYATYISPGRGYASIYLPPEIGRWGLISVYMAGIIVELIAGIVILFFLLPRMKKFTSGLFILVISQVMLVHSSLYMIFGSYSTRGDSFLASQLGGVPDDLFISLGLVMVGIFVFLVSLKAVEFLSKHMNFSTNRKTVVILFLFWLPILIAIWASVIQSFLFTTEKLADDLIYGILVLSLVIICITQVPKFSLTSFKIASERGPRFDKVVSVLVVFMVSLMLWMAVFGASTSTAHGVMLKEPPVEVENHYTEQFVGNIEVYVASNGTVNITIKLKGTPIDPSPLDLKIHDTFEYRPYWPTYISASQRMMWLMFKLEKDQVDNLTFDQSLDGEVWSNNGLLDNARMTSILMNYSDLGLGYDEEGNLTILLVDPWMVGSSPGYLDSVEFHWDDNLTLEGLTTGNISHNLGGGDENFIGWRNMQLENAPSSYTIILRKVQGR